MAGNKVNTKTKGREDKNKNNKSIVQGNEGSEDLDFSLLRKPIPTSVTGFGQARKIFDLATEELKGLLSNECDLLYECKVCRNIFRSLANFVSHKRIYCKEKFSTTQHGHFYKTDSVMNEMLKIKKLEEMYLESLNGSDDIDIDENDGRIPLTKDLTTIIEKIVKKQGVYEHQSDTQTVTLQKIPNSSVAVFQNIDNSDEKQDKMKAQVKELDFILSKDKAVLQNDGNFKIQSSLPTETDNIIQISDDEDEITHDLKCKICDQNFSTQKTLRFHMKYKHLESRLVYPCPDCLEIFSTSWSVYRHLFKVHRKSAAQIRRLRESIQAKAFKMNNPPAFYEKRKNVKPVTQKISEEERLDQENQAWMDNVEGDGSVPRCFGCGRTFERRAALAAHAHTCQPRSRALAAPPARRAPDAKRIEIQIRKDYHKGPPLAAPLAAAPLAAAPLAAATRQPDPTPPRPAEMKEIKVLDEDVSAACKPIKETIEKDSERKVEKEVKIQDANEGQNESMMDIVKNEDKSNDTTIESPEKDQNDNDEDKSNGTITESPEKDQNEEDGIEKSHEMFMSHVSLPFAHQEEKSNLIAFRQRIRPDIDVNTLLCKKCDIQHKTVQQLYDHMAEHYKWMRYACKLCNFKTYYFSKLPEHLKVVHKLKGDMYFYYSTIKAIDGNEATELSENADDSADSNDVSPNSRRQSRCSSDSSRLSDDSSSSSTRTETGSRKRKMFSSRGSGKRKKETLINDEFEDQKVDSSRDKDSNSITMEDTSSIKTFEENSSDMDDIDEKISKRQIEITSSVASRRPVRKKTKRKNEDFEYDLSNLLKMEAQGYRDSQASLTNTKSTQNKKKTPQQENQSYYEIINRDCCGALVTLSKKAVEASAAHIKNTNFTYVSQKEPRSSNIFVRPMIPKIMSRAEKSSPKKDAIIEDMEKKDTPSPQKELTESTLDKNTVEDNKIKLTQDTKENNKDSSTSLMSAKDKDKLTKDIKENNQDPSTSNSNVNDKKKNTKGTKEDSKDPSTRNSSVKDNKLTQDAKDDKDPSTSNIIVNDSSKPNLLMPPVLPIKFHQGLELMKNPIINKNITDFKKAGMKTKILVIKPINRSKDGKTVSNTPLTFQTIKLKEPKKSSSSNEEKSSDQVVVVKVPKVDSIPRTLTDTQSTNNVNTKPVTTFANSVNNHVTNPINEHDNIENYIMNDTTESSLPNDDDFCINNSRISNEKSVVSEDCMSVSESNKELITDKETIQNVPDCT